MTRPTATPRDFERAFTIDELFFSTTDRKAIIRSGNATFARVANYDRVEQMLGRPHNIIRHPDMPRSIFRLMWDYLDEGRVFAGFVKNMATDGCYYWVLALVMPIDDGFLSIRFKPSGAVFAAAKALYADLLAAERSWGDKWREGMAAAGAKIGPALAALGFDGYDSFMHTALASEMSSRRAALAALTTRGGNDFPASGELADILEVCRAAGRQLDDMFARVDAFLSLIGEFECKSAFLLDLGCNMHRVSLNALIASYHLDEAGRGLSVITHDLAAISQETTVVIQAMAGHIHRLTTALRETAFSIASAKLQVEMAESFARELIVDAAIGAGDEAAHARTRADLTTLVASFASGVDRMLRTLPALHEPLGPIARSREDLTNPLRRLFNVQVAGKVQAAQIEGAGHFEDLFGDILERLDSATVELDELSIGLERLERDLPTFERVGDAVRATLDALEPARA